MFYKDERGQPIILAPGQDEIFRAISMKEHSRYHIMCHTRYGKSLTAGLAVLTRAATFPEKWAIIAGTKPKAKIIMDYVIAHIFDNDFTRSRFLVEKGDDVDNIRRYRNKNRVTFKVGMSKDPLTGQPVPLYGEVFIGSASDALGFGASNVIEDESALIDDTEHSLVVRMLGDHPEDNFMAVIGNPFNRNHFLTDYHNPNYRKISIDCYRSLNEGRITQETIDENRPFAFFRILFENKFPSQSEIDETGYMYLLTDADLMIAKNRINEPRGIRRLGHDVAHGGRNFNAWVLRTDSTAQVIRKDHDNSIISTGDTTVNLMKEYGIMAKDVYIDDSGIGGGESDYLASQGIAVNKINFGERTTEEGLLNTRSQVYAGRYSLMTWIKSTGQLIDSPEWTELLKIRYKKDITGKTKIESKEDMRKRGIESPDVADALALTFAAPEALPYHYQPVDPAVILSGGVKPLIPGIG